MRKNTIIAAAGLLLILSGFRLNLNAESGTDGEIKLLLGESKIISVDNPSRIVIGNPSIIDVGGLSKNEVTVIPKAVGKTILVFWDVYGEHSYNVKVLREDVIDIKRRVDNLFAKLNFPGVYTQAEEEEGKVFLLGRVKSPQDRERIITTLGPLKEKVVDLIQIKEEEAVIDIDVQLLELNKDASSTLGFTWPDNVSLTELASPGIAGVKWSHIATLFKVVDLKRDAFTFRLDALVQEGKAQILSRPHLACLSGKEAELTIGGEKPVFTTQIAGAGGQGTSVEYKEYGIKLKIKPILTEEKRIKLVVNVEVSDVGAAETIGSTGATNTTTAKAYPLTKRSASTELYIDSGQTMVIGGLIKKKSEEDIRKVPGLGDVPIIGLVFRKKDIKSGGGGGERGDTELFITLTPAIINSDSMIKDNKNVPAQKRPVKEPDVSDQDAAIKLLSSEDRAILDYAKVVQTRILRNFTYNDALTKSDFEGQLKLGLHLSFRGELLDVTIKEPSGYAELDNHAVSVVKDIGNYPPFPSSLNQDDIWIEIPIVYKTN